MVRPFTIDVPDDRLRAIRDKAAACDWNQLPDSGGWDAGVGKATGIG